jgi:A/G-specific adenine glycosylase
MNSQGRTVIGNGASNHRLMSWVRRRLPAWFRENKRWLPWRCTRDPYAIWVSEIMLQQTQVATVVPYFKRFLEHFPDLTSLARASEQQVLKLWEGLGYYRRAVHLHAAARRIVTEHGGHFPDDPTVLGTLPGFGRYTVGAVLSQAFDQRLPILEANSRRVLCRLFGIQVNPEKSLIQKRLWNLAEAMLPAKSPGEFNEALMELGALLCTPQSPRCVECPLTRHCRAFQSNLQDRIPRPKRRSAPRHVAETAVVVRRRNKVLIVQRPWHGRWPGMWEFPHGPNERGENCFAAAVRVLHDVVGIIADPVREIATLRHGVMQERITLVGVEARFVSGKLRSRFHAAARWVRLDQLQEQPLSSAQRRLVTILSNQSCGSGRSRRTARFSGSARHSTGGNDDLPDILSDSGNGLGGGKGSGPCKSGPTGHP